LASYTKDPELQRTTVLLAKGVGALELCWKNSVNTFGGPGIFTEETPAGDYNIQKFSLLPGKFFRGKLLEDRKVPKGFCTLMY